MRFVRQLLIGLDGFVPDISQDHAPHLIVQLLPVVDEITGLLVPHHLGALVFEDGKVVPLDVKVGDRILFGKYSGSDIKLDGEEYLIMREDEVLGILDAAPKVAKKAS